VYSQKKDKVFYIDTNYIAHFNDTTIDLNEKVYDNISLIKKVENHVYFYSDSPNYKTRIFFKVYVDNKRINETCKHDIGALATENYNSSSFGVKEVRSDGINRFVSFKSNNPMDYSVESFITKKEFELSGPSWDYEDKLFVFSKLGANLKYEYKNRTKVFVESRGGSSIKRGGSIGFPTIVNNRYIIYIYGVEHNGSILHKKFGFKKLIRVYDRELDKDLDVELEIEDAVKTYYDNDGRMLLVLVKNSNDKGYDLYQYSVVNGSKEYKGRVLGACYF